MTETLQVLEASRIEVENILQDIQQRHDHIIMYNRGGLYEEFRKQENNYINKRCQYSLLHNNKYISLSNLSIELFNQMKGKSNIDLLFKYEDVMSQMQEIVEIEAYNLGKYDSQTQKTDSI